MKKFSMLMVLAAALLMSLAQTAQALSVSVNPSRVRVGSTMRATVQATYGGMPPGCVNQVNFGDGTGWNNLSACNTTNCTSALNYRYGSSGTFTVQAKGAASASCSALLNPPATAATTATVCPKLAFTGAASLTPAQRGKAYSQQLSVSSGGQSVTFRVYSGSLPPGLSLSYSGLISGVPSAAGSYSFGVQVSDACGGNALAVRRTYSLAVDAGVQFSGSASPASAQVRPDASTTLSVRHNLRAETTTAMAMTLTSAAGSFIAGGQVLGTVSRALNVTISGGSGSAAETVTVPQAVAQRAAAMGVGDLQYRRVFRYGTSDVVQTSVKLEFNQKALGSLRVRKLRLYFDNKRPEITVKRFATGLRATAQITYEGSGQLMAYWEVDNRIISHENLNLVYGRRSIDLQSPQTPALPTFSQGTHRVRLVITNPAMDIDWPVALYFVEQARAASVVPIAKAQPPCGSHKPYAALQFDWSEVKGTAVYVLEFFKPGADQPFFSAQTKQPAYNLPQVLLDKFFKPGEAYVWRVRAMDAQTAVLGESDECALAFKPE